MAFKFALFRPSDGAARSGYFGFAWTTLFFGPLAPLARRDFSIAFLTMVLEIIVCMLIFRFYDHDAYLLAARVAIVTFCWALFYNEMHALNLLIEGFNFQASEEVVAALNQKFSQTGRAERLRLLRERSLMLVVAGLSILQLFASLPSKTGNAVQTSDTTSVAAAPPANTDRPAGSKDKPTGSPSTRPEPPAPVASPAAPSAPASAPPAPPVAPATSAGTMPSESTTKAPLKSDAEIRAELEHQCDIAMGSQFDNDLPKNAVPVMDTSGLSDVAIEQAISSCEGASKGRGRRFFTQLGRAYAAKAVLLVTKSDDAGARENMEKARQQWKTAEYLGSGTAMNFLGAYYNGTFNTVSVRFVEPPEYSTALTYWLAGDKAGNIKATRNAGALLLRGAPDYPGVVQDVARAVNLLEKAVRGGDLVAAATYGKALYYGDPKGVSKDVQHGLTLLAKACVGGDSSAKAFYDRESARQKRQSPAPVRPDGC